MPATRSTSNLDQSIGHPPRKLAIVSIVSFIFITVFFYYLLFVFQFNYQYYGSFIKNNSGPNTLILKVENGNNLSPKRLLNWRLECRADRSVSICFLNLVIGKNITVTKDNVFLIANAQNLHPDFSKQYTINLKSLTFYNRLFHNSP